MDTTLWPKRNLENHYLFMKLRETFSLRSLNSGKLLVDDATSAAKAICAASPNSAGFALLPVLHGSTTQEAVVLHRRHIEDLLYKFAGSSGIELLICLQAVDVWEARSFLQQLRSFEATELSLNFQATEHSGDRRKRSQNCSLIHWFCASSRCHVQLLR